MRVQDWDKLLHDILEEVRKEPFQFGVNDCATMSLRVTKAITGNDYGISLDGAYDSRIAALRFLSKVSKGEGLREGVTNLTGIQPESPLKAHRGDIALYLDREGKEHLAVVVGHFAVGKIDRGLLPVKLEACKCCWRT